VQNHGHWAGNTGERVYQDRMLSRSKAQALYSTGIYTFEHLRFMYMTGFDRR